MNGLRPFLTANWRHLAMLNYEVPAGLLQPLIPAGTELDAFDGTVLASVVGFRFLDTRVLGIGVPGHRDFDEIKGRRAPTRTRWRWFACMCAAMPAWW